MVVPLFRPLGAAGLIYRQLGAGDPCILITGALRQEILDLVRSRYADFGPTLACEKLAKLHDHKISVETLRQWMIADDLWKPKVRKQARIHQRRPRRPCRGELVQIDGSPHDWFEDRGPRCTLIVFIERHCHQRADGRCVSHRQTTKSYGDTTRLPGRTMAGPWRSAPTSTVIFRVNHLQIAKANDAVRACPQDPRHRTRSSLIPHRKGRVERVNQTMLQDRLVKELRLAGIVC